MSTETPINTNIEDVIDEELKLTEEEISKIYNTLEEENRDKDLLSAAEKETEENIYTELEEMESYKELKSLLDSEGIDIDDDSDIDLDDINIDDEEESIDEDIDGSLSVLSRDIIKESLLQSDLNLNDKDADKMIDIILAYRNNKSIKVYDKLPSRVKMVIDVYWQNDKKKAPKESIAKNFLNNIVSNLEMEEMFSALDGDMSKIYNKIDVDLSSVVDETYQEIFDTVDEVREIDPNKAENILKVQQAFEDAKSFNKLKEYLLSCKPRDVRKFVNRYSDACFRFNKIVNENVASIKIYPLEEIYEILKRWLRIDKDQIKEFCVLLAYSVIDLDFNDIGVTSYTYRLVSNIYAFKHRNLIELEYNEEYNEYLNSIKNIINDIQEYKSPKEVQ